MASDSWGLHRALLCGVSFPPSSDSQRDSLQHTEILSIIKIVQDFKCVQLTFQSLSLNLRFLGHEATNYFTVATFFSLPAKSMLRFFPQLVLRHFLNKHRFSYRVT